MTISTLSVRRDFFSWVDQALSQEIPGTTVAFHFNLYEGTGSVHIQLVGTESFVPGDDPAKDYWPCAETFTTGEEIFEVPLAIAGSDWPEWLETIKEMVNSYIVSGAKSGVLRGSKGVGIGFVNGDMHLLWQSGAA